MLEPFAPHLFTTRAWRLGAPPAGGEQGDRSWTEVAAALGLEDHRLSRGRQVHGTAVLVAAESAGPSPDADIVVADSPGLGAAVQTADCLPILLGVASTGAVAAAHAGWRGLAANVPAVAVSALCRRCGRPPADVTAVVGPSIGPCCYEVGADVRQHFESAGLAAADLDRWFLAERPDSEHNPSLAGLPKVARADRFYLDMWQVARDQLQAAGVLADRIAVAGLCTASHPDRLCSYRRDGAGAGRLAAAIRCAPRRP